MRPIQVDAVDDPRLDDFRKLSDAELLAHRNLFVAEGRLVTMRLLGDPRYKVRSLLLSPAALRALEPALAATSTNPAVYVCAPSGFRGITGFNIHRGCLALVERPHPPVLEGVLREAFSVAVLESVTNADNVGGVFRNAAAFGVDAVLLNPVCCDPLYRKSVRTSMGAALTVPFVRMTPWPESLSQLSDRGFELVALTPAPYVESLESFVARTRTHRPRRRLALLLGSEGPGLSEAALTGAHHRVRIPTRPEVDSLNLAVAAGIAFSRLLGGDIT
jgi:tRNA G18 (ribose-2'-O)-methylase SpoU